MLYRRRPASRTPHSPPLQSGCATGELLLLLLLVVGTTLLILRAEVFQQVVVGNGRRSHDVLDGNLLLRSGWTRSSMKVGDAVTVEGFQARDGSNTGNARSVTLNATGQTLSMGSARTGREEP